MGRSLFCCSQHPRLSSGAIKANSSEFLALPKNSWRVTAGRPSWLLCTFFFCSFFHLSSSSSPLASVLRLHCLFFCSFVPSNLWIWWLLQESQAKTNQLRKKSIKLSLLMASARKYVWLWEWRTNSICVPRSTTSLRVILFSAEIDKEQKQKRAKKKNSPQLPFWWHLSWFRFQWSGISFLDLAAPDWHFSELALGTQTQWLNICVRYTPLLRGG